jgi:hypothetical protein
VSPLAQFEAVWDRAADLSTIHAFATAYLDAPAAHDEVLRSQWATRVSALDLYIHELVAQRMVEVFEGRRTASPAYLKFKLSAETAHRIKAAVTATDASAAFNLDIREQLGTRTFQFPDDIADGIRCFSDTPLWEAVVGHQGVVAARRAAAAKSLRLQLSAIVRRRNKIVHEGDLQPGTLRTPWAVTTSDLALVTTVIEGVVRSIDAIYA